MAEIIWSQYQVDHIEERHSVTRADFEQAWHNEFRVDLETGCHGKHGSYTRSVGCNDNGFAIEMVWRQQAGRVWPITAFFPDERAKEPKRRKRKRKVE